jgi:hypothetical protein
MLGANDSQQIPWSSTFSVTGMDSLVLCASNLDLHDLVNMAMTCHRFRDAAYSDTVWEIQCRSAFFNIVSYTF